MQESLASFKRRRSGDRFFLFFFPLLFEGLAEAAAREEKLHLAGRDAARRGRGGGGVGLTIKDFKSKASLVKRRKRREGRMGRWGRRREMQDDTTSRLTLISGLVV